MKTLTQETISQKADRLKAHHRVILTGRDQALVIDDHDTYLVFRPKGHWTCDCPWGRNRRYCQSSRPED